MSAPPDPLPVHTIGHSTRPVEDLVALLRQHGIRRLVDVRRYPGSRRHPQYNREALAATLKAAGIEYRHAPELGGRRAGEEPASGDLNAGWRSRSFRAYADYMGTAAFRSGLDRLVREAGERAVAIMCAEAVPWRCHRNLISDALVARGLDVRHIVSGGESSAHTLNPMAVPGPDGTVTYPPVGSDQPDLF